DVDIGGLSCLGVETTMARAGEMCVTKRLPVGPKKAGYRLRLSYRLSATGAATGYRLGGSLQAIARAFSPNGNPRETVYLNWSSSPPQQPFPVELAMTRLSPPRRISIAALAFVVALPAGAQNVVQQGWNPKEVLAKETYV